MPDMDQVRYQLGNWLKAGVMDPTFARGKALDCWGAVASAVSNTDKIVGDIGWGIIDNTLAVLPAEAVGGTLVKEFIGALVNLGSSSSLKDAALQTFADIAIGKLFSDVFDFDNLKGVAADLTSEELTAQFQNWVQGEGVEIIDVEGERLRTGLIRTHCKAFVRLFLDGERGKVTLIGHCVPAGEERQSCRKGVLWLTCKVDADGIPVANTVEYDPKR